MGGQKSVAFFYRYLADLIPVSIISTSNNVLPPVLNARFFPALGSSFSRYFNPFLIFKVGRIIKKYPFTHLIIVHPYLGWLGLILQWLYKLPLIVHSQNIESTRFKTTGKMWWPILQFYEKWVHKNAACNFFITEEDKQYAIHHFKLNPQQCFTITYGFENRNLPDAKWVQQCRKKIIEKYNLPENKRILLFNGTLSYEPNLKALDILTGNINKKLMQAGFEYTIIICGKNLPESYQGLAEYKDQNIIYAGFVDDINTYFMGADVFLNPVIEGGGIKTKLVEALGYGLQCISTESGAMGIPTEITGSRLIKIKDGDWDAFANAIMQPISNQPITDVFFNYFYWGHIAEQAAGILKNH
ncbi:MAG: hypothetical protein ABS68_10145 [Niastella sp. SCN 39-18]|nr:glycosyltransferase family 4 protein [Sphingobacteriales bacterium]ODT52182.1 MAG: hypothetical protein ABS68_10145 [Niastella sp. SCN 39-18]OJW11135.1 MAG: hypothetical protein BGO53_01495 [Sphingobacteriales bacterium 39-19]